MDEPLFYVIAVVPQYLYTHCIVSSFQLRFRIIFTFVGISGSQKIARVFCAFHRCTCC